MVRIMGRGMLHHCKVPEMGNRLRGSAQSAQSGKLRLRGPWCNTRKALWWWRQRRAELAGQ